jgi:hypothetical protein
MHTKGVQFLAGVGSHHFAMEIAEIGVWVLQETRESAGRSKRTCNETDRGGEELDGGRFTLLLTIQKARVPREEASLARAEAA